ncbi:unnamed protein product [Protopolystoma xenopodis]|uniref:Uncharacterized protein n=1 Tax=Protopolystoma xenopodis TaxID=117903 RepID=A0A3S5CMZ1_9PLAT|nr:unnamed protein product [Protopolystoma xenopodis]
MVVKWYRRGVDESVMAYFWRELVLSTAQTGIELAFGSCSRAAANRYFYCDIVKASIHLTVSTVGKAICMENVQIVSTPSRTTSTQDGEKGTSVISANWKERTNLAMPPTCHVAGCI